MQGERTTYDAALRWLYAQRREAPRDPERARILLDRLSIPADVSAVHVVGTAGKGTVATMVAHGLAADGGPIGRFTSPHVEDFRERIWVDGEPVPVAEVVAFIDRIRAMEIHPAPAFFEISLALALQWFARRGVLLAVVEAGVGARADATAVLERVVLTVLTNVGLDHAATLGPTVAQIAHEKASAVRPGVPVVTGATGVARAVVAGRAAVARAPFHADPPGGPRFAVPEHLVARDDPARRQNQRLAAAALRTLGATDAAVAVGVAAPRLPARRERFEIDGRTVLLDGAHNPWSSRALSLALPPEVVLVFGALERKDGRRTLRPLLPFARHLVITSAAPGEDPMSTEAPHVAIPDPTDALRHALALAPLGGTVVVAGSLYLAGRVRPFLRQASSVASTPDGGSSAPPPASAR